MQSLTSAAAMDVILEFRAGRMILEANQLRPDSRRGLVQLGQDDSGLTHFCWRQRGADGRLLPGEPEVDICLPIPGEVQVGCNIQLC